MSARGLRLVVGVVFFWGMGGVAIATDPVEPTDPVLVSRSSTPRLEEKTPLPEALLGHWVSGDGTTHYYFSPRRVTVVSPLEGELGPPLNRTLIYEIGYADQAKNMVHLRLQIPSGVGQVRMLQFAPDRRRIRERVEVWGHVFSDDWQYVDDRQQP